MKKIFFIAILVGLVSNAYPGKHDLVAGKLSGEAKNIAHKIVVVLSDNIERIPVDNDDFSCTVSGVEAIDKICGKFGITSIERFYNGKLQKPELSKTLERFYVFTLAERTDILGVLSALNSIPEIKYAEPLSIPELHYEPDDPFLFQQWYFAHTHALEAWDIVRGDTTRHSVIAIVDTGIDWEHDDLQPNIWVNEPEDLNGNGIFDPGDNNGIDDDGNGFVDDVIGWDFGANDNNPSENNLLHGSAVASVASEATDNDVLGAGMGFSARLMAIKAADSNGNFPVDIWQGIVYAADNGAQIINCSWGTTSYNQYEQDIINAVWAEDALVIASAGGNSNNTPIYPAAYDHVMAVSATDQSDRKASFAGFGEWVDICAPGIDIFVISGNDYQSHNGTSYSAAMVSGLAALVRAWYPDYSNDETEDLIKDSADPIDHLNPGFEGLLGAGRINAYNCVERTGVDYPDENLPFAMYLRSSPNPFNPSTTICYSLPAQSDVRIEIYNIIGQRITTLLDSNREAGYHSVAWDASAFTSGVYFARLEASGRSENVKMVLLK